MAGINQYTVVCLHYNGADASTTFGDSSNYANTMTAMGDAQLDTAQKKFGSASGLFDGTDDYVKTPLFANLHFGSNNFTLDTWAYLNEAMGTTRVFGGLGGGVDSWSDAGGHEWAWFIQSDSKYYFAYRKSATVQLVASTNTIAVASGWHHFAVVKNGNTITLYVDGVPVGSASETGSIDSVSGGTPLLVIGVTSALLSSWNGWIDEFRIQNGEAYWTADFSGSLPSVEYSHEGEITEGIGLSDAITSSSPSIITEGIGLSDTFDSFGRREITEAIALNDSIESQMFQKTLTEAIGLTDSIESQMFQKTLTEGVGVGDAITYRENPSPLTEASAFNEGWIASIKNSVWRKRCRIA